MRMFFSLLKTQLNMNYGISSLRYKFRNEPGKKWAALAIGLAALVGFGSFIVLYCLMVFAIYIASAALGTPEIVLLLTFLFGQLLILVFGVFYIMSSFYFSSDIELLIPLPLKPSHIVASRFAVVMINEYLTMTPVLLPPIIIYGLGTGAGLFYWVKALLLFVVSPVIPLAICSLFVMALMRVVNISKKRDLLAIIGGIAGLFIALGFNLLIQQMPKNNELDYFKDLLESSYGFIETVGKRFPPSLWATWGLSLPGTDGTLYIILFLLVAVALFIALLWLANRVFLHSILSGSQYSRGKRGVGLGSEKAKYNSVSSPLRALFSKEWKLMLRTPVYMLNGVAGSVIGPAILIMMFIVQRNNQEFGAITRYLENPENAMYIALGGLALMLFMSTTNSAVYSTSISREGPGFWFSRMIPVKPGIQALSKLYQGVTLSLLGITVTAILLAVFIGIDLPRVIVISVISLAASVPMASVGIIIDILKPKLEWTSEQQAMKQNMNALLGMFASMLITVPGVLVTLVMLFAGASEWLLYTVLLILFSAMGAGGVVGLMKTAEYRYTQIEV